MVYNTSSHTYSLLSRYLDCWELKRHVAHYSIRLVVSVTSYWASTLDYRDIYLYVPCRQVCSSYVTYYICVNTHKTRICSKYLVSLYSIVSRKNVRNVANNNPRTALWPSPFYHFQESSVLLLVLYSHECRTTHRESLPAQRHRVAILTTQYTAQRNKYCFRFSFFCRPT